MEECAVRNCPPLSLLWVQLCGPGTQNQETTHRPGCSEGAGGRCCWELPTSTFTSTFTVGSALWARHTEPRDYSPSWLLWRSRRKVLLGTAYLYLYLYLYCGFSTVGQAHRTKRLLTVQVALKEQEEGAVGNCLPLPFPLPLLWVQHCGPGTQNQETTHCPGCSGTWGRCCLELPISMHPEPRDYSPSRLLWNSMGKMPLGAIWCSTQRRNWRAMLMLLPGMITLLEKWPILCVNRLENDAVCM